MSDSIDEILVLGGEFSGKSRFIKRTKEILFHAEGPHIDRLIANIGTLPTVGTELHTIQMKSGKKFSLREVGSALSSRWESYFDTCKHIMFLVDASDPSAAASSMVLLHEILAAENQVVGKRVVVALNKTDLTDGMTLLQVSNFLRLGELQRDGKVQILKGSCADDTLCIASIEWLEAL